MPAPPRVALTATLDFNGNYTLRTREVQKDVVLEALDHHGAVVGSAKLDTTSTAKSGRVTGKNIEGLRVRVGEFSAVASAPGVMAESVSIDTTR